MMRRATLGLVMAFTSAMPTFAQTDPGMVPIQLYTPANAPPGIDPLTQFAADVSIKLIAGAQGRAVITANVAALAVRMSTAETLTAAFAPRIAALEARPIVPDLTSRVAAVEARAMTPGPQGIQGVAGASITGAKGDAGAVGATGAASTVPGPIGLTGGIGATGPAGPAGLVPFYSSTGLLTGIKCWQGTVTTTAGGAWTASYANAGFTAPPIVEVQAVSPSTALAGLLFATMTAPTVTSVYGVTALAGVGGLVGVRETSRTGRLAAAQGSVRPS